MIIDSQVHIWKPDSPERPWRAGGSKGHRPVPLGYRELRAMMDEAGVERAILIPPYWEGDHIDCCLEAIAAYPERFGMMARFSIDRGPARLDEWMQEKGMLGLRLAFNRPNERTRLLDGSADWLWNLAQERNIPLMIYAPSLLAEVADVAKRHPDLKIIIDHMGFDRETMDEAAHVAVARLTPLAAFPNVAVKVSAVPFFSSQDYPYRNLHEPLQRIIEAFGAKRAFWGTDISRVPAKCSYRQSLELFLNHLAFLSQADKASILGDGVAEWLGWKI